MRVSVSGTTNPIGPWYDLTSPSPEPATTAAPVDGGTTAAAPDDG